MKPYRELKKQFKLVFIILVLLTAPFFLLQAQTWSELNDKIEQKNADIKALEKEIAGYQAELGNLGEQKISLSNTIKELDLTRKKLSADISITQSKIDKTNFKLEELGLEIGDKEELIENHSKALAEGIRDTYEAETSSLVEKLLSEENFSEVWKDVDNIATIQEKIKDRIEKIREVKTDLEGTKLETEKAKLELVSLRTKLSDQKKIADQNAAEKNKLLTQTKNSEAAYQKLLVDRLAKKDAFEKEVRDFESQLQFILDPSKLPLQGALSWPLDVVRITQLFGKTVDAKRLYASGSHGGVDFGASVGTPLKSMADGTVMGTGDTDATCVGTSFGKWIFIKYNNGLASTYGHLSLIKVSKGQKVKRGEVVGYSGNTGHTTGPHLHVAVYAESAVSVQKRPSTTCEGKTYTMPIAPINAYLDPMEFLPKLK